MRQVRSMLEPRYNLMATVINALPDEHVNVDTDVVGGHWETQQDPDTNAITRVWVEDQAVVPTNQNQPGTDWRDSNLIDRFDIECYVRGFPNVGFRSSANSENFLNGTVEYLEFIQVNFPAKYVVNRRMYITNIRNPRENNRLLWIEEETGNPTLFEVQGVTPTFDPFGRYIDNLAVVKRSEHQ